MKPTERDREQSRRFVSLSTSSGLGLISVKQIVKHCKALHNFAARYGEFIDNIHSYRVRMMCWFHSWRTPCTTSP